MYRSVKSIHGHSRIDGVIPGVRGQRAFPNGFLATLDPFVMLDHIGPQEVSNDFFVDGAHSAHPHRGFETITFLFEGGMNHSDSLGNRFRLNSGDVQRMNAGKGIIHGGDFEGDKNLNGFHEVQLWVNLPADQKFSEPEIQNVKANDIPEVESTGSRLRIIAGSAMGKEGPIMTHQPTIVLHGIQQTGREVIIKEIPLDYNAAMYVLKGRYEINGHRIHAFQTAVFNADAQALKVEGEGEFLFIAGKPIKENVVMGGPFVMNTNEEIDEAYTDFQAGKFGNI